MNIEFIGEKDYLHEIVVNDSLWVAMKNGSVYMQKNEGGNILFTWSSMNKAKIYIEESEIKQLNPVEVPLNLFLTSWLSGDSMAISQVSSNPRVGTKMLVFSNVEIQNKLSRNS